MQNRAMKAVKTGLDTVFTFYVRDAQGNVLGVYTRSREIERSGISCVVSVRLYRKRQRVNIKHEEPTILIAPTAKQTRHHAHSKCQ
jgi:hypothetical protein